ncbi:MAG: hypothetical protein U9P49_04075 [Thermodesulfobacteriota bacterium]|nr:hypothetical protein [Thermodesulfobacteriota bacterium]
MVIITPEFNNDFIETLRNNTLDKLGYRDANNAIPLEIERTLDEALTVAKKVVRPKGIYHIIPVLETNRHGIKTEAGIIQSVMFSRLAGMCSGNCLIVFMIATLGIEFERACGDNTPVIRQLVFDTVGSECAEMVADMIEADWRNRIDSQGLQCSWRFSPGYCDWGLEGQKVIFKTLDAKLINMSLSPYLVMVPSKSISAVALLAKDVPVPAPCVFCAKKNCPWRRLPWKS